MASGSIFLRARTPEMAPLRRSEQTLAFSLTDNSRFDAQLAGRRRARRSRRPIGPAEKESGRAPSRAAHCFVDFCIVTIFYLILGLGLGCIDLLHVTQASAKAHGTLRLHMQAAIGSGPVGGGGREVARDADPQLTVENLRAAAGSVH